jgi:phosphoribosylaminoimidazole-succinocarboxamide synthase
MPEGRMTPLLETDLPGLRLLGRGKVRDNFEVGGDLLMVCTDRISAFDHVLPNGIPDKGKVLNQITLFWFEKMADLVRNHVREHQVERYPEALRRHAETLRGRSVLVTRLRMLPVECVVRGYLAGSGFKEYSRSGTVCGLRLPAGLAESARLPEPLFTPSTKAVTGHDENIPFSRVVEMIGLRVAEKIRDLSLAIYRRACAHAESRGILIADTKLEFGLLGEEIVLADEVLTPDSSRFWPADSYRPGGSQPSFDKQFVRDYLESIGWDKNPPAPRLPDTIVNGTADRYRDIYHRLTGRGLE